MGGASGSAGPSEIYLRNASPIYLETSTCSAKPPNMPEILDYRDRLYDNTDKETNGTASPRNTQSEKHWTELFLEYVPNQKERRVRQTDFQLAAAKPVHNTKEIQTDFPSSSSAFPAKTRLDDKTGYIVGLLSRANSRSPPQISTADIQTTGATNDQPPIWTVMCTKELCRSLELDGTTTPQQRHACNRLFGRLFDSQPITKPTQLAGQTSNLSDGVSGLDHKLQKIGSTAISNYRVPRSNLEHSPKPQNAPSEESEYHNRHIESCFEERQNIFEGMSNTPGHLQLCKFCDTPGSTALSTHAANGKISATQPTSSASANSSACQNRPGVVDQHDQPITNQRLLASITSPTFSDHRCCRLRVGSSTGRLSNLGKVEQPTKEMALQQERIVRNDSSDNLLQRQTKKAPCCSANGQPNCGGVHQKRGRDEVRCPSESHISTDAPSRQMENNLDSRVPAGQTQPYCRWPFSRQSGIGMAFTTTCPASRISEIRSTENRLVCLEKDQYCEGLCHHGLLRQISSILQRFQQNLEIRSSLGVSSAELNPPCTPSLELCERDLSVSSANVVERILVTGPTSSSTRTTNQDTEPTSGPSRPEHWSTPSTRPGHETFSMESWGWANLIENWSGAEKDLLRAGWRESTLRTYKPAWDRWVEWCAENDFNHKFPDANSLAKYLAYLHNIYIKNLLILLFYYINPS